MKMAKIGRTMRTTEAATEPAADWTVMVAPAPWRATSWAALMADCWAVVMEFAWAVEKPEIWVVEKPWMVAAGRAAIVDVESWEIWLAVRLLMSLVDNPPITVPTVAMLLEVHVLTAPYADVPLAKLAYAWS